MAFLLHFLRPCDQFVDIGANVGSYSVLASAVCGAKSIAFEPVLATFKRLSMNVSVNQISELVTLMNCAVGVAEGRVQFSIDRDAMNKVVDTDYAGITADAKYQTKSSHVGI
jgi:FkbM family methyltransferase